MLLAKFLWTQLFREQRWQNEQTTNSGISIPTAFTQFVRRVRRNWDRGYALFQQTSKQRTVCCADKGFCVLLPSKRPANNEQTDSKRDSLAFAEFGTLCLLVCSFAGFWWYPRTYAHTCTTMPRVAFCCNSSGSLSAEGEGGQILAHSVWITGTLLSPAAVDVTIKIT